MSTASAASWTPVDTAMPGWRWWTAVTAGSLAPVLLTPLADVVPEPWHTSAVVALAVVAVVLGLGPTLAGLGRAAGTRAAPGGVLLAAATLVGLAGGIPLAYLTGDATLPAATGLAGAVHLVTARWLRNLLAMVPGADLARLPTRQGDAAAAAGIPPEAQDPWHRLSERTLRRLPWIAGLLTVAAFAGGLLASAPGTEPVWASLRGAKAALAVVFLMSPTAFLLARLLPSQAARDRGRELGIVYGDVDLRRVARTATLVLDPLAVMTAELPRLVRIHTHGRLQVTAALQAAASVAAGSSVPSHRAVERVARGRGLELRPTRPDGDDSPSAPTRRRWVKDTAVTLGPASAFATVPPELAGWTLYVGWGGVARAAFELVPQVDSQALSEWGEVSAAGLTPVFVSTDEAGLAHVGAALEVPSVRLHPTSTPARTWTDVAAASGERGVVGVVGDHGVRPDGRGVIVFADTPPAGATPTASRTTVRVEAEDLGHVTKAVGLARKTGRVTAQSTLLAVLVEVAGVVAAVPGGVHPTVAVVVGAVLPLAVAANALRPRSFARA